MPRGQDKSEFPFSDPQEVAEFLSRLRLRPAITGRPVGDAVTWAQAHPSKWARIDGHPEFRVRFHNDVWWVERTWPEPDRPITPGGF
jgi:hypothetical protein